MKKRVEKRYGMAFKCQVVDEDESGETIPDLQKRCGIGGSHTIQRWVEQYGQEGLRYKVMHLQHADAQNQVNELEARVKELESALAQVTLDKLMDQAMVEVAEREHGLALKKGAATSSIEFPPRAIVEKSPGR